MLNKHLTNVQDGIDQKFELVDYLRNLARLKKALEDRYEHFEPMGW